MHHKDLTVMAGFGLFFTAVGLVKRHCPRLDHPPMDGSDGFYIYTPLGRWKIAGDTPKGRRAFSRFFGGCFLAVGVLLLAAAAFVWLAMDI